MISSEVSIAFGFRGRSHTLSNGCTSSSDALGNALDLIRNGRAHTILCGGADAPITPGIMAGFGLMRAVPTKYNDTPEKASRPFDKDRDGFVLGEGAWMLTIEEKEQAVAQWVYQNGKIAGWSTSTLPLAKGLYLPIKFSQATNGILVYFPTQNRPLSIMEMNFLQTIAQHLGIYLERYSEEESI